MNVLMSVVREIIGLFVDDEFLALGTLAVVGIAATVAEGTTANIGAAALLGGCLAVLFVGVCHTARSSRR
jgi:hypothetical protein